jgi:hypothetical protein
MILRICEFLISSVKLLQQEQILYSAAAVSVLLQEQQLAAAQ